MVNRIIRLNLLVFPQEKTNYTYLPLKKAFLSLLIVVNKSTYRWNIAAFKELPRKII